MISSRSIFANGVWSGIAKAVGMIVPFIVYAHVLRVLGAESYGRVAYIQTFSSYFVLLSLLGISDYAQRECSVARNNTTEFAQRVNRVFTVSCLMTFASLVLYFFCFLFVPGLKAELALSLVFSLMIVLRCLQMDWIYTSLERFELISKRDIISKFLYLILCLVLISSSDDYIIFAAILVFTASVIITVLNQYGIYRKECVVIPHFDFTGIKECFVPVFFLGLMTLGSKLFSSSDVLLIKWLLPVDGDKGVGLYNASVILPHALEEFLIAIAAVITPQLYIRIRNSEEYSVTSLMNITSNALFLVAVPAVLTCLFFSKELLLLFAGEGYLGGCPVLQLYSITLISSLAITMGGTRTYIARNKERKLFYILISASAFNIILDIILIRPMGIIGVTLATVISNMLLMVVELTLENTWKYVFSDATIKYILAGSGVAVVFTVFKLFVHMDPIWTMISAVSSAGLIYALILFRSGESTLMLIMKRIGH